jgi:hypothetical protein
MIIIALSFYVSMNVKIPKLSFQNPPYDIFRHIIQFIQLGDAQDLLNLLNAYKYVKSTVGNLTLILDVQRIFAIGANDVWPVLQINSKALKQLNENDLKVVRLASKLFKQATISMTINLDLLNNLFPYSLPKINLYAFHLYLNDESMVKFSEGLISSTITKLDLSFNNIGVAGAETLAAVLSKTRITELNLMGNKINDAGCIFIANHIVGSMLTNLDVGNNSISDVGCSALSKVLKDSRLVNLKIGCSKITNVGCISLSEGLVGSRLEYLSVGSNAIENEGCIALATTLKNTALVRLNLANNHIKEEGMTILIKSLQGTSIRYLDAWGNHIWNGSEFKDLIRDSIPAEVHVSIWYGDW